MHIRGCGRDSRQLIKAQMKENPDFFIGAFEGSRLIGSAIASSDGRTGWINRLSVDPGFRRKGIARALIAEAEEVLRKRGVQVFAALIVDSNEASKSLFKKCGYTELGFIKYFSKRESEEA